MPRESILSFFFFFKENFWRENTTEGERNNTCIVYIFEVY